MKILKENWEVIGFTFIIVAVFLLYMFLSQMVRNFRDSLFRTTKHDVVVYISGTIVIAAVMISMGIFIAGKISNFLSNEFDKKEEYHQAAKIETKDLFGYGMQANIGNAFIYGELEAVTPVKFPELDGDYIYVVKIEEVLTFEYRWIGKVYSKHYFWKLSDVKEQSCEKISFLGHIFPLNKIDLPSLNDICTIDYSRTKDPHIEHICTVQISDDVRYKYYGVKSQTIGTIYTELKDEDVSDNTLFFINKTIDETVGYLEYLDVGLWIKIFWIFWIILTGLIIYIVFNDDGLYWEIDWKIGKNE